MIESISICVLPTLIPNSTENYKHLENVFMCASLPHIAPKKKKKKGTKRHIIL